MIHQIASSRNTEYITNLLDNIIDNIHTNGPVNAADFEKLSLIKLFHENIFRKYESKILYTSGLFYKVNEPKNFVEEVYSIFSDSIIKDTGKKFTPIQADAYKNITSKKFFSFSAPTSAGKSHLFRELITDTSGDILIVVPSRALIAEYLSVVKQLVDKSVLVLPFIDNINICKTTRRIFIITPERGDDLFKYSDMFNIKYILFDEAQLSEERIRGMRFDAFVRRVSQKFNNATKVFTHPFINNPEAQLKKHHILTEESSYALYEQNTVGKIFITISNKKFYYFSPYAEKTLELFPIKQNPIKKLLKSNGTILIYTSKNKLYDNSFLSDYWPYIKYCPKLTNSSALKYISALKDYIGVTESNTKNSLIVKLMERGIVIHHGSMPLKMRLIIEEFVREKHAKICFSTSTLKQGINMPFDAVFIDNYTRMDVLTLKNLIGRAGRSTSKKECFEFGYVFIDKRHINTFSRKLKETYQLKETSLLDNEIKDIDEDFIDLVEAIKTNSFDQESKLTSTQLNRIKASDINEDVLYILDNLFESERILTGKEYYEKLDEIKRKKIKECFKKIYTTHLRRKKLSVAEQSIISTAIPILLWQIQGKTFKEILALRFSYLTRQAEQRELFSEAKKENLSFSDVEKEINNMKIRFSQVPSPLPDKNAVNISTFKNKTVTNFDYDLLVYDTYDYIDKVINLSLSAPLCATFNLFYESTGDIRAKKMYNYIKYGTHDNTEIWLLRYGFAFEDIIWLKKYIKDIDEHQIVFNSNLNDMPEEKFEIVERYT